MSTKRVLSVLLIVVLALPALAITPAGAQDDSGPYWPTGGWRTSTPEEQGMSSVELAALVNTVATPSMVADSMIVIRHGYVVAEAYFDPVTMDDQRHIYSSSKSFTSALIGIAIEQGLIPGIDAKVLDLYADRTVVNVDARREAITVGNLLMMSSGLECDLYWSTGDNHVYDGDDWVQAALEMPMMHEPGAEFHYCNPATTLLSGLINQTAGMSALEFANENLFGPMGITNAAWTADAHNVNFGASELQLTPRDMAKFGYLYLRQGEWDGQQLVPAEWVTASTMTQMKDAFPGFDYGYQWWVLPSINAYFAIGFAGQYVWVYPDKDLVFVMTSGIPDAIRIAHQAVPLIGQLYMLTTADEALPADAAGVAELEAAVNAVSHPQAQEVPALPALAATVSGQTYNLLTTGLFYGKRLNVRIPPGEAKTWFDTQNLSLTFDESAEAGLTLTFVDGTTVAIPVGLDGLYRRSENRLGPVAARGAWTDDNTFQVYLKLVRDSTEYRLDMTFEQELLEIIDYEIDDAEATAMFGMLAPPAE